MNTILCIAVFLATVTIAVPEVTVSLVGGGKDYGTVILTENGKSGPVCDAFWEDAEAAVVCRMLGYTSGYRAIARDFFNYTNDYKNIPYLYDVLDCKGYEKSLSQCYREPIQGGRPQCWDMSIAGVVCHDEEMTVRLVDGGTDFGTVEISFMGVTGHICDSSWGDQDAHVVCRMLNFKKGYTATSSNYFKTDAKKKPFLIDNVGCKGGETSIKDCYHVDWMIGANCQDSSMAGVICNQEVTINLVGGDSHSGTVVIKKGGRTNVFCDNNWDKREADVICRMLGFQSGGSKPTTNNTFGYPLDQVDMLYADRQCEGTETSIVDCAEVDWDFFKICNIFQIAGVRCDDSITNDV